MASTLTGHHPEDARPRHPCASRPAQFRPHSLSSGAVRGRTRTTCLPRSGTLPAGGGWPGAVLESVSRGQPQSSPWAHFWAHSPPSMAVHRRPPGTRPRWPRTVADIGERRSAVLESVLGASPREFESRILRHADLRQRIVQPTGWLLAHWHLAQFVSTTRPHVLAVAPGQRPVHDSACSTGSLGAQGQPSGVPSPASPIPRADCLYPHVAAGWPP